MECFSGNCLTPWTHVLKASYWSCRRPRAKGNLVLAGQRGLAVRFLLTGKELPGGGKGTSRDSESSSALCANFGIRTGIFHCSHSMKLKCKQETSLCHR